MTSLSFRLSVIGLVAILSTASRGAAAPPASHDDLQNQLNSVQTTVNGINTKVNALQSQLDQIPPAWSQTLPAAQRFVEVLGGAAVLDKETGLIWEKAPDSESDADRKAWHAAQVHCNQRIVGNRKGWRLPTVQELTSLVDPSVSPSPTLPAGHPFSNVQSYAYWSATTHADESGAAWFVHFDGSVSPTVFVVVKTFDQLFAWCVRGGHGGPDAQ